MLQIGAYHVHIVNLQGVIVKIDMLHNMISSVGHIVLHLIIYPCRYNKMYCAKQFDNRYQIFLFQVSLLLEYCSKGNLKSFLVENRKQFSESLENFSKIGMASLEVPLKVEYPSVDIHFLYFWTFQVRKNMSHLLILHMFRNFKLLLW